MNWKHAKRRLQILLGQVDSDVRVSEGAARNAIHTLLAGIEDLELDLKQAEKRVVELDIECTRLERERVELKGHLQTLSGFIDTATPMQIEAVQAIRDWREKSAAADKILRDGPNAVEVRREPGQVFDTVDYGRVHLARTDDIGRPVCGQDTNAQTTLGSDMDYLKGVTCVACHNTIHYAECNRTACGLPVNDLAVSRRIDDVQCMACRGKLEREAEPETCGKYISLLFGKPAEGLVHAYCDRLKGHPGVCEGPARFQGK